MTTIGVISENRSACGRLEGNVHGTKPSVPSRRRDGEGNRAHSAYLNSPMLEVLLLVFSFLGIVLFLALQLNALNEKLVRDSHVTQTVVRASVIEIARLALGSDHVHAIEPYLHKLTQGPEVAGIILSDAQGRILANVWERKEPEQIDVVGKTLSDSWESLTIKKNGRRLGSLSLLLERQHPPVVQREVISLIILILSALSLIALATGRIVWKIFNNRAQRIIDVTEKFARGDYSVRTPETGTGPLAVLSGSFNRLAYELDHHIRRLRASEERFELAVNGSNECIWDWNIGNDRLYLSSRFTDILGYDKDELPDLFAAFQRWIHPEDKLAFNRSLQNHLVRDVEFRCVQVSKNGDAGQTADDRFFE